MSIRAYSWQERGARQGFITAFAPALLILQSWAAPTVGADLRQLISWEGGAALLATLVFMASGLAMQRAPRAARAGATAALLGTLVHISAALLQQQAMLFMLTLLTVGLLIWMWSSRLADESEAIFTGRMLSSSSGQRLPTDQLRVQAAALGTLCVWIGAGPMELGNPLVARLGLLVSCGLSLWMWGRVKDLSGSLLPGWAIQLGVWAAFVVGLLLWFVPSLSLASHGLVALILLIALRPGTGWRDEESLLDVVLSHPARIMVITFALTGAIGGLLLGLPAATTRAAGLDLIDAMFTSFSATCVTGLAVLDTPGDFTFIGQVIILVLIQVGGLGIMTFSTAAATLLGRRMSIKHEGALVQLLGSEGRAQLQSALRIVLLVTFGVEAIGAMLLTSLFLIEGDSFGVALWRGVFTSISAYCNAGFALQSDSLVSYQNTPLILLVISLIIVVGSLGPLIIAALPLLRHRKKLPVQARIAVWTTVVLLFLPTALLCAIEWENTLAGMPWIDRVMNAWFQSVTTRTAGFNSIDLAAMRPASLTLMELLMFIGGSPGSTAGGAKTTTFFLLVAAVVAVVRGQNELRVFGWHITHATILKAISVATAGVLSIIACLFALQLTQPIGLDLLLFESISALATVGISIGATGMLDDVGKIVVIVMMFAGRIGPLTLFLFFSSQGSDPVWKLPSQDISVG
jgi:trk system potassium uptake protein